MDETAATIGIAAPLLGNGEKPGLHVVEPLAVQRERIKTGLKRPSGDSTHFASS